MSKKRKMVLASLPMLALVIAGSSVASAHMGRFESLTEEQKSALREARELRKEGNEEEAWSVLEDVGLDPEKFKKHMRGGLSWHREEMRAYHKAMHEALENGDFEAFKEATANMPFANLVTEENFEKFGEAHELREAGDHEGARAILEELGFPTHPIHGTKHKFETDEVQRNREMQ